jgi:hypothetical protein
MNTVFSTFPNYFAEQDTARLLILTNVLGSVYFASEYGKASGTDLKSNTIPSTYSTSRSSHSLKADCGLPWSHRRAVLTNTQPQ